jgi:hypothetical protein
LHWSILQQSGTSRPVVRKKAALCLLRLMRKTPADAQLVSADTFAPVMAQLLEERDVGLLLSCVTLLLGICARTGSGACGLGQQPALYCLAHCRWLTCFAAGRCLTRENCCRTAMVLSWFCSAAMLAEAAAAAWASNNVRMFSKIPQLCCGCEYIWAQQLV